MNQGIMLALECVSVVGFRVRCEGAEERALFQGASCSSGGGGWTVVVAHHEPVVAQHNETHDAAHAVEVHA